METRLSRRGLLAWRWVTQASLELAGSKGDERSSHRSPISVLCIQHIVQTLRGVLTRPAGSGGAAGAAPSVLYRSAPRQRRLGMRAWESPLQNRTSPLPKHAHCLILTWLLARLKGGPACHVGFDVKVLR